MTAAAVIFALTYLVIGIQKIPRLHLGRPAGALLGACAMVIFGVVTFDEAKRAIDLDTILFLLGMMIVIGYLEISGFFELVERRILGLAGSARSLLVLVVVSAGVLSALFMNDTICLMLTPILVRVTRRVGLPPVPYLLAVALASNVGSACTVMGNPQNAMIGVRSGIGLLPFASRLWPVSAAGLAVTAALLAWTYRKEIGGGPLAIPPPREELEPQRWLMAAALLSGAGLVAALAAGVAPAAAAMGAAAALILAGAARPRHALRRVDWSLLLFFGGLFVVMRGVADAGIAHGVVARISGPLEPLTGATIARLGASVTLLSQLVSNVPAVMLYEPSLAGSSAGAAHAAWLALAAFSTLAGNLTIIGSAANVIVFETAARDGVEVRFFEYVRVGMPLTLITLGIAWAWLT